MINRKTIAIANQKGGVGKTNITFNLSGALAERKKRILLIDLDQQGNLSSALLDNIYNLDTTIVDILLDDAVSVTQVIQKTSFPNIDIIPSNIDLSRIDIQLAASIKEYGLIQPINVEYIESQDYFRVINGQRRYEAAKLAGILEIPCIIKNINKHLRLIHQLIENIQRDDLPALEEAEAIQTLVRNRRIENPHYSQREASRELGLPKTYGNEMLTLLKLPEDIKRDVRTSDAFPKSLLLLLIRQGNEKNIREFYKQIKERKLTVREVKTTLKKSKNRRGRPGYYQYIFQAPEKQFTLTIKFKEARVDQSEIFNALSQALHSLR
ncbi:hypothetical protein LCGC14_1593260 [marine sediment metagenome]|uniref:ParB-like N-terminal domain-containing protein n=1 Tax=marine sediment metagenome TaxID=412755 RepID=A0A0F9LDT1_9ZZZZ